MDVIKNDDRCFSACDPLASDLSILASECFITSFALASIGASSLLTEVEADTTFTAIMTSTSILSTCITVGSLGDLVITVGLAFVPSLPINTIAIEAT